MKNWPDQTEFVTIAFDYKGRRVSATWMRHKATEAQVIAYIQSGIDTFEGSRAISSQAYVPAWKLNYRWEREAVPE